MTLKGQPARSALYHNNHDGTFTDVTDKAGVATPCFAMGGAVGDYNNDGWPDMVITCLGHTILYRNNGDGTFTDVTKQAGIDDPRWSTGAAFGDYDNDGFVDLMVTRYVDFQLDRSPDVRQQPHLQVPRTSTCSAALAACAEPAIRSITTTEMGPSPKFPNRQVWTMLAATTASA